MNREVSGRCIAGRSVSKVRNSQCGLCKYFQLGFCFHGDACQLEHVGLAVGDEDANTCPRNVQSCTDTARKVGHYQNPAVPSHSSVVELEVGVLCSGKVTTTRCWGFCVVNEASWGELKPGGGGEQTWIWFAVFFF